MALSPPVFLLSHEGSRIEVRVLCKRKKQTGIDEVEARDLEWWSFISIVNSTVDVIISQFQQCLCPIHDICCMVETICFLSKAGTHKWSSCYAICTYIRPLDDDGLIIDWSKVSRPEWQEHQMGSLCSFKGHSNESISWKIKANASWPQIRCFPCKSRHLVDKLSQVDNGNWVEINWFDPLPFD